MIKSANVTLGAKSAVNVLYVNYFEQFSFMIQPALEFIEMMTNVRGNSSSPAIKVEFSSEIKQKYRISNKDIREAIGEMFDEIDKSGEIPSGYDWARREWERRKEYDENEKNRDFCQDDFYEVLQGRIIEGWFPLADDCGLSDVKRKMRRVVGKLSAKRILISVEYDNNTKTIVLYENVLGDINNRSNLDGWLNALACGLFYAWYYDCGGNTAADYVIEGLCEDLSIHFMKELLGYSSPLPGTLFYCDMFEFPEASAQYMENIELKDLHGDYILFRRIFKKAIEKAIYAENYLEMAYGLYEGLSMPEIPKDIRKKTSGRDYTKYWFDGKEYKKGELCLAIVKKYVSEHPGITAALLKDVFDKSIQGTRTIETVFEANARIANSRNRDPRAFIKDPADWIHTADDDCVVSTQWGVDNIDRMIDKAKALGYKISKK